VFIISHTNRMIIIRAWRKSGLYSEKHPLLCFLDHLDGGQSPEATQF